ncbi:MAG: SpoIIE family protein phosphatase [Phycisphaerae bacterium]|nr:SpoIIE family protein phosphatase [Phycisphaerae bacterium]MCZ2399584.1 SpoIIE family protein phosphatase [Phycisphaerae bacterium]NUQ50078.1 SpoIIE family protein phosphatase [Phycisphaerae bacterium]
MKDPLREIADLRRILDVARHMAVVNDLDVLLGTIVEAACEVLGCERATIYLYDAERRELYSRVAKGIDAIRFPADRGIAGAAATARACVNVPDAYADARFNPEFDRKHGFRTRNLLAIPLENLDGDLIGVVQAINKHGAAFDREDESLAEALSAQAGVALERARLLEQYAEKQRMQRDLDLARSIQQGLFPKRDPHVPGYEIAGWNRPADETGGDCYDFIPLSGGRLALLLADATGHGIGAALVIAEARSLVRALLSVTDDLARVAVAVNRLLAHDLAGDRFVTAFLGVLDPVRHCVEYVSGGQGPLLLVTREAAVQRPANALPFAVLDELDQIEIGRFDLAPGATLVLLTDGFYEAGDPQGELFGEARVISFIQGRAAEPLGDTIVALHDAIQHFTRNAPQADDLTALLVRRL